MSNDSNTTQRDELIDLLDNERWKLVEMSADDEYSHGLVEQSNPSVADAILAAGYGKPRTITTVEELDALPTSSVIRADNGEVLKSRLTGLTATARTTGRTSRELSGTARHSCSP